MVKPGIAVLQVSARAGAGLDQWYAWLRREAAAARGLEA
jgi:hydrogenase nickel incorporation protein HypB